MLKNSNIYDYSGCNFRPFGVLKKSESDRSRSHSRRFFLAPALTIVEVKPRHTLTFFSIKQQSAF